jgi:eukaryotic-like serine/threonine-protein kinase
MLPGSKLGCYEILATLGAGGMGEVYRARDTRLARDVAIKMVSAAFARDPERVARFEREAKLLASLNHPNIAAIYGVEESGEAPALIMELVEGLTLADRLKAGPLPVDEAIRTARQIADGLEYAHERGVVHRDLKPANIKVAPDDSVKILDFGLAKAIVGETLEADVATSPTLTHMATQAGYIIGTAAYMSPEQAKGKPVDRRADIWAFGCVLYEMLSGKVAFHGETITDTLAAVVRAEPDWSLLPAATPPRIRVLLQRCLQKDPRQRLRDIGDARISIDEVLSGAPLETSVFPEASKTASRRREILGGAALVLVALAAGAAVWFLKPAPSLPSVTRTVIDLPPADQLAALDYPAVAISPDGKQLAYIATHSGQRQIFLRAIDSLDAKPILGTEGAVCPFFSPDGQWLGFFAGASLRKTSVTGGVPLNLTLANAANSFGASWSNHGIIAFAPNIGALRQVPDSGGTAQPLTRLAIERGQTMQSWPDFIPGGDALVFTTGPAEPHIAVKSLRSGEQRDLGLDGTSPRYAPSGHLLFAQGGNLMAVRFDPARLQITGQVTPVVQGVLQVASGAAQYSVSRTGSLVYVPGTAQGAARRLVWISRDGTRQVLPAPARGYVYPRLSPDGRRLAVAIRENLNQTFLYDFGRDTLTKLTDGENAVWTPDGKRIAFTGTRDAQTNMFWLAADGSGGLERLSTSADAQVPNSISRDGKLLAFVDINPATGYDVWIMRLGDGHAEPFLRTPSYESAPSFSPDGRWLVYVSDESGRFEVYVQPYPGPGGVYQISTDGGTEPLWNPRGKELFYRSGYKMMSVDVSTEPAFSAGKPKVLFEGSYLSTLGTLPFYDVSPDGQRFLMLEPMEQTAALTQIVVVQNWFEELKRLVPPVE